ncbi:dihydroorotate dehydrogenase fumarate, partial [Trichoderma arundinaceum]
LLLCPSTGAVTTRTSLLDGFPHSADRHRYAFFDPATGKPSPGTFSGPPEDSNTNVLLADEDTIKSPLATLNTLGYSPFTLSQYLSIISSLAPDAASSSPPKTIIISVTGSPAEISASHSLISDFSSTCPFPLAMEINLSCPNIPNLPPPAYSASSLTSYLDVLPSDTSIPIGIKIPPYTHAGQFDTLTSSLLSSNNPEQAQVPASKLSFLTATNTLGSCLLLDSSDSSSEHQETLPGEGIGGMAGPPLHPLALGNVATLRRKCDADPRLAHLDIIGVGGVYNGDGYRRMRRVGALAVGLATALGRQGVDIFTSIERDINSAW